MTDYTKIIAEARKEASEQYQGDIDRETGAVFDDWGYAESERAAFLAGATFMAKRLDGGGEK